MTEAPGRKNDCHFSSVPGARGRAAQIGEVFAMLFLALTHDAWSYLYSGATTKSSTTKSSTTAQLQHLRRGPNSAAARTQRNPELHSSSNSGSSAKNSPTLADVPSFAVGD